MGQRAEVESRAWRLEVKPGDQNSRAALETWKPKWIWAAGRSHWWSWRAEGSQRRWGQGSSNKRDRRLDGIRSDWRLWEQTFSNFVKYFNGTKLSTLTSVAGGWAGLHSMPPNSTNTPSMMDACAGSHTWSDSKMGSGSRTKIASGVWSGFENHLEMGFWLLSPY